MNTQLLFLGTGAFDYNPRLLTDLNNKFDYNARRSSCILINNNYLIDCGDHTLNSLSISHKKTENISDIFITHLHRDHFNLDNIKTISLSRKSHLNLWVREDAKIPPIENTNIIYMKLYNRYKVNDIFYITPLQANHDEDSFPQHFLIEINNKKIFYGCDGAWLLTSTYYFLKNAHLDLCILDGTCGNYIGDYRMAEHNSIPMINLMLPSLKEWGTIDDKTLIYISHIAPSLHKPHINISKTYKKYGYNVAYDGLDLRF